MIFRKKMKRQAGLSLCGLLLLTLSISDLSMAATADDTQSIGESKTALAEGLIIQKIGLTQALAKALEQNPRLTQYPMYLRQYDLKKLIASRKPAWELSVAAENVLGSGEFSGIDGAEISVMVQRLFESAGKAEKRALLVDSELQLEQQSYQSLKLEVLADTRRNYFQLQKLQLLEAWAKDNLKQQLAALKTVQRLARAGAINQADKHKMRLQVEASQSLKKNIQAELAVQSMRLQGLWSGLDTSTAELANDRQWRVETLADLPKAPSKADILSGLDSAPDYLVANAKSRVAQSAWQLSNSLQQLDFNVGVGLRHFQSSRDQALLLEFSIPLQQAQRAKADIKLSHSDWQIKQAEQAQLRWQLQQRLLLLRQSLLNDQTQMSRIKKQLLPEAQNYQGAAKLAYEAGQYTLLQWLDAQVEVADIKRQLIEIQGDYWNKWIELERLIGRSTAN